MTQLFANNAYGSLASEASAAATSMTLATGQGARFPTPSGGDFFLLTLVGLDSNGNENAWEIVKVTARATDVLTVVRAQEGTTAVIWPAGSRLEARSTAGTLTSLTDAIEAAAAAPVQSVNGYTGAVVLVKGDVGLGNVENKSSATIRGELTSGNVTTALTFTPENAANKGAANGYAPLGSDSKIASTYLPAYVDDVLEYANLAALPGTGVTGVIYVTLDTNKVYRWGGSSYTEISPSPGSTDSVSEGSVNLYFTNARAQAALSGMYLPSGGGTLTGNLTFTGTGNRITGDFSNGTVSSRPLFQSSGTNLPTNVGVIPNGTSTVAITSVWNSSSPDNASFGENRITAAEYRLTSGIAGTGTYLPMTFYTGGSERVRVDTSGNVGIGTNSPSTKLHVYTSSAAQINQIIQNSVSYLNFGVFADGNNYVYSGTATNLLLGTNNAERMRIAASGDVIIGTDAGNTLRYFDITNTNTGASAGSIMRFITSNSAGSGTVSADIVKYKNGLWNFNNNDSSAITAFATVGAERMRIDSAGNVGIGTSSPAGKLSVKNSDTAVIGYFGGTTYAARLGANASFATIEGVDAATGVSSYQPLQVNGSILSLATGGSERVRIDTYGAVLIGTTSGGTVASGLTFNPGANSYSFVGHAAGSASGNWYSSFGYDGTVIGAIYQNGTTNVAYSTSSDYRLKENIQPMQGALDVVAQLNPVTYTWKVDGSDGQGFIAHELQAVVPDCVTGEKDAVDADGKPIYQGIDTSFLVATLTKAIQELNAKVDAQAAEIAALKATA